MKTKIEENKFYFIGIGVGILVLMILTLVLSLILMLTSIDDGLILPIKVAIYIVSLFIACVVGIKKDDKGYLKGLYEGIGFFIIYELLSLFIYNNMKFDITMLILFITSIIVGFLSGIIVKYIKYN